MSTIDGDEIQDVTIDGDPVQEITVDGDLVWQAAEIIDDFEDGNRSGWTVPSSTGSDSVVTPGLNGSDYKWRHEGFREGHLRGADAVDRGPQPGDTFEFWFRIVDTSGDVINRFEFSADGTADDDKYRIEWEQFTGDNELSLEKISGGSQEDIDVDTSFAPSVGQAYRVQVAWNVDGSNNISVEIFTPDDTRVGVVNILDNSTGEFAQPGVYVRTNGNNIQDIDGLRIID